MSDVGPAVPSDVFDRLSQLSIETTTVDHPPAFTVEEGEAHVGHLPGVHIKNLFLCDAKKKMWLIIAPWDRTIDLKTLPQTIGSKRLSFGSADRLMRTLGVAPGSVSPFCLINDTDQMVTVILDAWMMDQELINAHPVVNTKTTTICARDLLKYIHACGHSPLIVDLNSKDRTA